MLVVLLLWAAMTLIMWAMARLAGDEDKRFLVGLSLAGLALRMLVVTSLHWSAPLSLDYRQSGLAGFVLFDDYVRDQLAWWLAQSGDIFQSLPIGYHYPGTIYLSALVYTFLAGGQHLVLVNISVYAFIGSLATVFVFLAGRNLFGVKVARVSALVMALHPEAIFWSSLLLREPLHICALAAMLWGVSMTYRGRLVQGGTIMLTAACAALLSHKQFGSATLLAGLVLLGITLANRLSFLVTASLLISLFIGAIVVTEHTGLGTAFRSVERLTENNPWAAVYHNIKREEAKAAHHNIECEEAKAAHHNIECEAENQYRTSEPIGKKIRSVLPPALGYLWDIALGFVNPHIGTSLFWDAWIYKVSFSIRSVAWQLLLPVLTVGIVTMWSASYTRVSRRRMLPGAIACLAFGVLILAAIEQQGDIWDGLRHRIFGFPLYALVAGWVFYHINARGLRWFAWLSSITITANFLLLIVYYFKWGTFEGFWLLAALYMAVLVFSGYFLNRCLYRRFQAVMKKGER